jgi:hypothetical protein
MNNLQQLACNSCESYICLKRATRQCIHLGKNHGNEIQ